MEKQEQLDDIVSMIDNFMSKEGGHMNISVNNDGSPVIEKDVKTSRTLECGNNQMACQVPTLHEGLDNE